MQQLARNGYTAAQVHAALHAKTGTRLWRFKYHLLDQQNQLIEVLPTVTEASVANNALADSVKRTAKFKILDDGRINFLRDRIQPWALLRMPDEGWAEFPLGVFILSTPPQKTTPSGSVFREVEAYDLLQLLIWSKTTDRLTITAGTKYTAAIRQLLLDAGIPAASINITESDKTLPADREWEIGTTRLSIVNALHTSLNYKSITMDENGGAVSQPYVTPASRASEYTYRDDGESVISPELEYQLDLFNIPNQWILITSEADRPPLRSVYTNENENSLTSTVSRGMTITADPEQVEAADQQTLDAMAARRAAEASQVFEEIPFQTAIMPIHSDADVFTLEFGDQISGKFSEVSWEMELKHGTLMKHQIRRVVAI